MRPVIPQDLDHCTRTVLALPGIDPSDTMSRILRRADLADRFRKRTGRLLAGMGDGSLRAAARTMIRTEAPPRCDAAYCAALAEVIDAIGGWRRRPVAARTAPSGKHDGS